tara:strand:+ start:363 stop:1178 length:816 start_codon:yes stop_codon:yes gene_type:complete
MRINPWVQCPQLPEVGALLKTVSVATYYRGSNAANKRLVELEQKYRAWIKDIVNLDEFEHFYFVNGVTDAINQWIATEQRQWQFLEGDYEYANMISSTGKKTKIINNNDVLYISNPTCNTGNFIEIKDIPNPVILDCAYIGSTAKQRIHLPKNTEQVFFSFSKGWGLVGQRMGVVFTKTPHPSLNPMKKVEAWNYTGVEIAHTILDNFNIDTIYNLYKPMQDRICNEHGFDPSDCFFIANTTDDKWSVRRRAGYTARIDLSYAMNTEMGNE